jgi:hypothetical protein
MTSAGAANWQGLAGDQFVRRASLPGNSSSMEALTFKRDTGWHTFKGIVSRDFVVRFLVSFDRSYISTHQEQVLLLLKVCFRIEFFDFRVWAW